VLELELTKGMVVCVVWLLAVAEEELADERRGLDGWSREEKSEVCVVRVQPRSQCEWRWKLKWKWRWLDFPS